MTDVNDNINTPKEQQESVNNDSNDAKKEQHGQTDAPNVGDVRDNKDQADANLEDSTVELERDDISVEHKEFGTAEKEAQKSTGLKWTNNKLIMSAILGILFLLSVLLIYSLFKTTENQTVSDVNTLKQNTVNHDRYISAMQGVDLSRGTTSEYKAPTPPQIGGFTKSSDENDKEISEIQKIDPADKSEMPLIPRHNNLSIPPRADEADIELEKQETAQIRAKKIELFNNAITSRTQAEFTRHEIETDPKSHLSSERQKLAYMQNGGADEIFNQRMAQLKMNTGSGIESSYNSFATGSNSNGNNRTITDFESRTPDPTKWMLNSQVLRPAQYSILTGTVIPATLITGINSDLPGQVTAQVSQNVYDTARGKYLLIPQGSRLIGGYSANVIYGQERILLGWQRIIFPDGRSLDIGNMPGTDQGGYSGVTDEVNNHYLRLFGSSILLSVISAGGAWAADRTSNSDDSKSFSNELASSSGSQMSQTSSELIKKNMNIAPTLTVRPGFRINVMVTKDITVTGSYHDYQY